MILFWQDSPESCTDPSQGAAQPYYLALDIRTAVLSRMLSNSKMWWKGALNPKTLRKKKLAYSIKIHCTILYPFKIPLQLSESMAAHESQLRPLGGSHE